MFSGEGWCCKERQEAIQLLTKLKQCLANCGLTAHPEKTKLVYCKKEGRRLNGYPVQFDFHNKTQRTIQDLAILLNPKIRGWINYYGTINRLRLKPVFYYLHHFRKFSGLLEV